MVSQLIDAYPDNFAVVEYQLSDAFALPWSTARSGFYGATLLPWFQYDGLFDAWPIGTYESKLISRQAVPTDVTIDVAGKHIGGNEYEFAVHVAIEPGGNAKTMRIFMIQTLDHMTVIKPYSRNTFRDVIVDRIDISLEPGESASLTNTLLLDDESMGQPDDVHILAWAQLPKDTGPTAEIYQGGQLGAPFTGFADCNDNGIPDDWDIADGTSEDADGDGVPDECGCMADINGDAVVDVLDLIAVLSQWGESGVPEDINGDGIVDVLDLLEVLTSWGPC